LNGDQTANVKTKRLAKINMANQWRGRCKNLQLSFQLSFDVPRQRRR
jgi:hypothetical protein